MIYVVMEHSKIDENEFFLDDLVDDVEKLRSYLNIDKTHLVGHSLGAMIGSLYARKYPNRLLSLTLLSTAAFRTEDDQQKIFDIISKIENEGIDNIIPILINRWFSDNFIINNQEVINNRIRQIKQTPLKTFLNVFRLYALTEMSLWLNQISTPSLIMTGESDGGCNPKLNKLIHQAMPNSKLEILSNLKHAITLEDPYLVGNKIKSFLNNLKNKPILD